MNNMCPKILPCILEALGKKEKLAEKYEILRLEVQEMVQNETNTDLNESQNSFDKAIATGRNMGILRIKNDFISIPVKISSAVQRKYYKALRLEQHEDALPQPTATAQETSCTETNDGNLKCQLMHTQLTEQSVPAVKNRSRSRSNVGIQLGQGVSHAGLSTDVNVLEVATPNHICSLSNLAEKTPLPITAPIQKSINKNEKSSSEFDVATSKRRYRRSRSRISFATYECVQDGSPSVLTKDINEFEAVKTALSKSNEKECITLSKLEEKNSLPITAPIQRLINEDESMSSEIFETPSISRSRSSAAKRSVRGRGRGRGRRGRSSRGGR